MRVYHRTSRAAAEAILSEGFRDGVSRGVELSAFPFDPMSLPEAKREVLLAVTIPDDDLASWEWHSEPDDGATGEFLVPAEVVNRFGPFEIIEE